MNCTIGSSEEMFVRNANPLIRIDSYAIVSNVGFEIINGEVTV